MFAYPSTAHKPINPLKWKWLFPVLLLFILLASCDSREKFAGVYKAEGKGIPQAVETIVELKPNGDGAWKVGDEEVPFVWYIKKSELRINTKGGGVIVGIIEGNTFEMSLPSTEKMIFKKIE